MLVRQLEQGPPRWKNQYVRSVTREGNTAARRRMFEVFEICDRKWRGIGEIPASGYRLRPEYAAYDAERRFHVETTRVEEPAECIAAQVLQGLAKPVDLLRFRRALHAAERRWVRPWSLAKAPAPPITFSAGPYVTCPTPLPAKDRVLLGHGSGGKLSADLLRDVFLPVFRSPVLGRLDDQAVLQVGAERLAFTTDSFVVKPLFFRGGDIGSLAVHGTR